MRLRRMGAIALTFALLITPATAGREPRATSPVDSDAFQRIVLLPLPTPSLTRPAPAIIDTNAQRPSIEPRPRINQPDAKTKTIVKATPRPKPIPATLASGRWGVVEGSRIARAYAQSRLNSTQYACLDKLWIKESGWRWNAENRSSGAYGIPQALPGEKMAIAGADWRTNPITQVKWGLGYISGRYGDSCSALRHSNANGWY